VNAAYAQYGRARLRRFLGDVAGAEADLAAARSKAGDGGSFADLRARLDLEAGILALDRGDREAAIAKLRAASDGPAAVDLTGFAFAALAEALCEEGRIEAGIEAARRAAESPSSFAEKVGARISRARCLARANRRGEAVAEARAALEDSATAGLAWEQVQAAAVLVEAGAGGGPTAEKIDGARDALTRMRESLSDTEARARFEAKIRDDDAASRIAASGARGRST
jgi:hypothetical protein